MSWINFRMGFFIVSQHPASSVVTAVWFSQDELGKLLNLKGFHRDFSIFIGWPEGL